MIAAFSASSRGLNNEANNFIVNTILFKKTCLRIAKHVYRRLGGSNSVVGAYDKR